ncbi:hypothetical protein NDU88_003445 [Pleurodeles waltl]|uniref:Uncharacterized protein n=1 Tax=Pleurodeles waltl TaxID=8319 RepID=A0AAV7LFC6_PLEWA|nr:hypothetical protein NDU88_003445 [Pleurodeles waltl]
MRGDECYGSTPSRSILPYPWGTSVVVVPDLDALRSGTYPRTLPGAVGLGKAIRAFIGVERRTKEKAVITNAAAAPGPQAALQGVAGLQEAATAPGPQVALQGATALQEAMTAPGPPAALQEAVALQEAAAAPGPPAALQDAAVLQEADADTRTWCPTSVASLPQPLSTGQEEEQPGIRPRSWESVASEGTWG